MSLRCSVAGFPLVAHPAPLTSMSFSELLWPPHLLWRLFSPSASSHFILIALPPQNFFGHLRMFYHMVNRTGDAVSFPSFVRLLERAMRYDRYKNVDRHLAPQVCILTPAPATLTPYLLVP